MQRPTASFRQHGLKVWRTIEGGFDTAFGSGLNPLRHLGAIGFLAFWLLAASGVVLFIFFDTSVAGAWRSIEELSRLPLGLGRLLRGLHRYAADVLVLASSSARSAASGSTGTNWASSRPSPAWSGSTRCP